MRGWWGLRNCRERAGRPPRDRKLKGSLPFALPSRLSPFFALVLFVTLSGCLPTCVREEDKSLLPADSTGRRIAAEAPTDTLALLWTRTPSSLTGLSHPRTVRFDSAGTLWLSDASANTLTAIAPNGAVASRSAPGLDVPYLAGFRGDTVVVFSAGENRFDLVHGGRIARQVRVPELPADESLLRYGAAWGDGFVVKVGSEETSPRLLVLDAAGRLVRTQLLPGPHWRHAGPLRTRGDTLLSICGFRPIYDRILPDGRRDTVALVGFDSPMLARSRRFMIGDAHAPPLMLPALVPMPDGHLFALNLRLGWVQVDVFDRAARLRQHLIQPHPGPNRQFWPEDLDVWQEPSGTYRLAVTSTRPSPALRMYRWTPSGVVPRIP